LQKIVQDLAAAGLVQTQRGAGGGVVLARPPEAIRIGEVVRRLEAGQALVECFRAMAGPAASPRPAGWQACWGGRRTASWLSWMRQGWRPASLSHHIWWLTKADEYHILG